MRCWDEQRSHFFPTEEDRPPLRQGDRCRLCSRPGLSPSPRPAAVRRAGLMSRVGAETTREVWPAAWPRTVDPGGQGSNIRVICVSIIWPGPFQGTGLCARGERSRLNIYASEHP